MSANLTREETAARAAGITVHEYDVTVDVRRATEPSVTTFPTTTTVRLDATEPETWLDFIGEGVDEVAVDGVGVPVEYDGARVRVTGLDGPTTVTVRGRARYSTSGEGLHRFTDPADGSVYLYTQYEPADARRVFACFEQPDMKGRFRFEVTAPDGWHVLSNTPVEEESSSERVRTVSFERTLPISSYITAIAAGPYHRATGRWQDVELGLYCRASLAAHLDADEFLEITRQGLSFFSETFGAYPWGKYDQILVPEYNLGAMENPGLVTFTEDYVFRGAATEAQHEARANTILHEMAHMWFGDLVTMRWWDDLWLKESFADYMGTDASVSATRFADAWASFANRRKAWAYLQDQLPTTHPIVADIPDLEAAKLNFDGITYAKGASVLKQLVAYVGRDAFFAGARSYFAKHAFGNTTLADLLAELSEASGRDLSGWSAAWLETTGVGTLRLETDADGTWLVQSPPRPHRLRIGSYAFSDSGALERTGSVELDIRDERTSVELPEAPLTLVNDGDLTYAKARIDEASLRTIETRFDALSDPLARALVWASLWNAVRDGELPVARYLEVVHRFGRTEANVSLLQTVLTNAAYAIEHYLPEDVRARARAVWLASTHDELFAATPGSDAQLAFARAFARAAGVDGSFMHVVRGILEGGAPDGLALDPDLRWELWTALAATGHASVQQLEAEYARDMTASGRTALVEALAARPDAEVRAEAWNAAVHDASLTNDHLSAVIAGFRAGGRRDLAEAYDGAYFAALREVWDERSIEIARRVVVGLFPASPTTDDADAWLAANGDAPAALRRLVVEQRDHLARDIRVRAANA